MTQPVPTAFDPSAKATAGADHWMQLNPTEIDNLLFIGSTAASFTAALNNASGNDLVLSDGSVWRQWLWNGNWYGRQQTGRFGNREFYFFRWILGRASSEAASAAATAANQANMGTDAQKIRAAQLQYMAQGMSEQDAASRAYGEFAQAQARLSGVPYGMGADPPPPPLPPALPPVSPSSAVTTTSASAMTPTSSTSPATPGGSTAITPSATPGGSTAITTSTDYTVPILVGVGVVGVGLVAWMMSGRSRRRRRAR